MKDAREASGSIPRSRLGAFLEPDLGNSRLPGGFQSVGRYSISCSWGLLDHSLNLQTLQQALRVPPGRSCGAPEHLRELSTSLHGASLKLPDTPTSYEASKQASKQPINQSKTKRSTQAIKQASNHAIMQASKQSSDQASKQAIGRRGAPKGLQ